MGERETLVGLQELLAIAPRHMTVRGVELVVDAIKQYVAATSTIDRIDTALRGDGRSAMLIVIAQEIINQYREGQERHE